MASKIAAVLIRSRAGVQKKMSDTLDMLKLNQKHSCVVMEDTESNRGMLEKVQGLVTWGEISDETVEELQEEKDSKDGKHFNLQPPKGGFERKGIKTPYKKGGALGYRGEDMNDLIRRML